MNLAWQRILGLVYADSEEFETAIKFFTQGEAFYPENMAYPRVVGVCQFILGNDQAALEKLKAVAAKRNRDFKTQMLIAWILATTSDDSLRDGKQAFEIANPIYQRLGDNPLVNEVMAAVFAENGDFAEAKNAQLKAVQIRESRAFASEDARPASEMRARLEEFYLQQKPARMPANRLDGGHPFPRVIDIDGLNRKVIGR